VRGGTRDAVSNERSSGPPARGVPKATVLEIHVQPRAKTTEVAGWHGDAIKIRLAAPPVEGAANHALVRFLATRLGVPRSQVMLVAGETSRRKRVRVVGMSLEDVMRQLELG
jgi:uncharacterized protein (TIGR00251 family)